MLLVANCAVYVNPLAIPILYECLDIHRMMLGSGLASRVLRGLERVLMRSVRGLITSSPAFVSNYFEPRQGYRREILLIENKPLVLDGAVAPGRAGPPAGPPWRIGWFGVIRCARSLKILSDLAAALPGQVEVVIAGRPALNEFKDFHAEVAAAPGVTFIGPYGAGDLARLYGDCHFTWAIDYFEAGQNSAWLLPNRVYEGGLHGAVSIALAEVQTGRWLAEHGTGLLLGDPAQELTPILAQMTAERYAELRAEAMAVPLADLQATAEDCRKLVARLRALSVPA